MLYLIYFIFWFKRLTPGEQLFTLCHAWNTRKERDTDRLVHIETAMDRAKAIFD